MRARFRSEAEKDDDARFTTSLAGLAVALLLAVAGLYLLEALAAETHIEDCLLQGRKNCDPDASPALRN
jgi:hypothetical protein